MNGHWSSQFLARWIGILVLISLVFGGFGEAYVPGAIMVAGDAAATAGNIVHHETLFRLGFAAYLVEGLCDAALTALLYLLLRPAGPELALIALLLRIVSTAAFAAAEFFYFAALPVAHSADYLHSFAPAQLNALALLMLRFYGISGNVPTLFYGVAWIFLGRLVFVSGYLPRWLGALLAIAGISMATGMIANIVTPAHASPFYLLPTILVMLVLAIWLLVRGADESRWKARNALDRQP